MRNVFSMLFGAAIRIGLSSRGIAIVHEAPWGGKSTILANRALNLDLTSTPQMAEICALLIPQIEAQCRIAFAEAACAGLPLHVTVSDDLARLFMVTPPHNSARLHDIKAAAAMRLQALYGDQSGDQSDEWCTEADWQASRPFLACALPRSLIEALCRIAGQHGLHIQAIEPNFVAAWNAARNTIARGAWFGVVHEGALTLGAIDGNSQHLHAVRSLTIPPDGHELPWLQEQLTRAALQLDVPAPQQICLAGNYRLFWNEQHQGSAAGAKLAVSNLGQASPVAGEAHVPAGVLLARKAARA